MKQIAIAAADSFQTPIAFKPIALDSMIIVREQVAAYAKMLIVVNYFMVV